MPRSTIRWPCTCGCGGLTGGQFVPGHDARLRGQLLRIWRTGYDPSALDRWANISRQEALEELTRRGWDPATHGSRTQAATRSRAGAARRRVASYENQTVTPDPLAGATNYTGTYTAAPLPSVDPDMRRFGVEIECMIPHGMDSYSARNANADELQALAQNKVKVALQAMAIPCETYTDYGSYIHRTRPAWKVVHDGSLTPDDRTTHYGVEIVSPPLQGREGELELKRVMDALVGIGAVVNRTCGLHVHQDAADFTAGSAATLLQSYVSNQDLIDFMVAPSRRSQFGSGFCRRITQGDIQYACDPRVREISVMADRISNRYKVVNLHAFTRHGTIEFRQHGGTVEWIKAVNWVRFTRALMAHSTAGVPLVAYGSEFRRMLDDLAITTPSLSESARNYLARRHYRMIQAVLAGAVPGNQNPLVQAR